MSDRYRVMRLDEVDGYADEGRPRWHMIRAVLGIESFGINAWRATEAGQADHRRARRARRRCRRPRGAVLRRHGPATFTVDGERVAAPAGSLVYVKDPRTRRGAVADEAGTTILVIGGEPGAAFSVSPWERSAEALRFWTTGDWDRAIEVLEGQLAEDPGNANVLYNLACAESRGGRHDAALDHLSRAVELEPQLRELAQATPTSRRSAATSASRRALASS